MARAVRLTLGWVGGKMNGMNTSPSSSWLTPWLWARWTWSIVIVLLLICYPFSALPVNYFLVRTGLWNPVTGKVFEIVYAPIIVGMERSPACRSVVDWQRKVLITTFGEL